MDSEQPSEQAGRFVTSKVVTIATAHSVHDTYSAFLPPLLPAFIEKLALTRAEAGLLTVFIQGPSLLQPLIGHLGDRFDLRWVVVLAPTVTAAAMSWLGVAPGYAALALLLLVAGASSAALHAVGPVLAGGLSGRRLGRGMGFWMVGGELGRTLGPVVVVTAVTWFGLEGMPRLMVAGPVASALIYLSLRRVAPGNAGHQAARRWGRAVRTMRPLLLPLAGLVTARAFMMAAMTTYLPLYLREQGAGLWLAGTSLTILEAAGMAGALVGGSLSDRVGRKQMLLFSMATTPILMLALMQVEGWGRFPLLLALGFAGLMVTPILMASVQESFPENRALANGIYMAMSFGLRSVVVVGVGALGDGMGMQWTFAACAVVALLGIPFIYWLPGARFPRRSPAPGP